MVGTLRFAHPLNNPFSVLEYLREV